MTDSIHSKLAAYRQGALTAPTFTGTAQSSDLCPCQDGTGTCKYRRLNGGMLWSCGECSREWIVPDSAHVEDPDVGFWSSVVVFLALTGSGILLAIGFVAGCVYRSWNA